MIRLAAGSQPGTLRVTGLGDQRRIRSLLKPGTTLTLNPQRTDDGRLVARLGRLLLPLPRTLDARAGEPLRIRVGGSPDRPVLEILQSSGSPESPARNAQRRYLPRQQPPRETFATLLAGGVPGAETGPLPKAISRLLADLARLLPTVDRLSTPEGLRGALRDSGILMEPLLALAPQQASVITGNDLKATLARLASQLRLASTTSASGAPSDDGGGRVHTLARATDGALARLATLQLGNGTLPDGRVDLAFELPIPQNRDIDELAIRVREEDSNNGVPFRPGEERWDLSLRFRFAQLGQLEARLRLTGEQVAVTWWSENATLSAGVEAALPMLQQRLESVGLTVSHMSAHCGLSPDPAIPAYTGGGLLDERA